MKDYVRVKRGMVFIYNIDPSVDKFNPPTVTGSRGKEYKDHLQYGWRPYVVVSNDIGNANSPTCNIVPMTTQVSKSHIPAHVTLMHDNVSVQVLCEHIYTVNSMELIKYEYTLSDEVMDQIDQALAIQLNLQPKVEDSKVKLSLDKIESIINGIISQRVEELTQVKKADEVDVEDAILRIGEGLESLLKEKTTPNPKVEKETQIEKFYRKYPAILPAESTPKKPAAKTTTRRKWTLDSMQEFLDDSRKLTPQQMVENYSFKDVTEYHKVKYYVANRVEKIHRTGKDEE